MTLIACSQCGTPLDRAATACHHCGRQRLPNNTKNRAQRGYGTPHQRLRRQMQILVNAGNVVCPRCGHAVKSDQPWHLDHTTDRASYLGASHAVCNSGKRWGAGGAARTTSNATSPRIKSRIFS